MNSYFKFLVMEVRNTIQGLQVAQDPKHPRIITEELEKPTKVTLRASIGGTNYIIRIREEV